MDVDSKPIKVEIAIQGGGCAKICVVSGALVLIEQQPSEVVGQTRSPGSGA